MVTINNYTICVVHTKAELAKAIQQDIDIIQFTFMDKEAGQSLHKVKPPKGYLYLAARQNIFGGLITVDNLAVCNCFYKKELRSQLNKILK